MGNLIRSWTSTELLLEERMNKMRLCYGHVNSMKIILMFTWFVLERNSPSTRKIMKERSWLAIWKCDHKA